MVVDSLVEVGAAGDMQPIVGAAVDRGLIFRRTVRVRSGSMSLFAYFRRLRLFLVCSCGIRNRNDSEPGTDSPSSSEPSPSMLVSPTLSTEDTPSSTSFSVKTTSV